ncbi:nucleolar protein 12-domain-containing protein [Melampsora americana]|nr:nucleolar protein 12-domain-containing protein [Melampsora americana]
MPHTNSKERNKRRAELRASKPKGSKSASSQFPFKTGRNAAVFDDTARHEYLTGFSTRKKAAKLAAQQRAIRREREERLELRRQLKATRLAKVKENLEMQAEYYGDDAFASIELDQLLPKHTETYVNEDEDEIEDKEQDEDEDEKEGHSKKEVSKAQTTVTVEAFSVDHTVLTEAQPSGRHFTTDQSHLNSKKLQTFTSRERTSSELEKPSNHSTIQTKKKKPGRIPYESKSTRKIERAKKERKRSEKANGKSKLKKRTGPVQRG